MRWLRSLPREILRAAVLTDHDGVEGSALFFDALGERFPRICASELSCTAILPKREGIQELHLLVYGIDASDEDFRVEFKRFQQGREKRFDDMIESLRGSGYHLDVAGFKAQHQGVLGRPHVADALVAAGHATSRQDAFDRFLYDGSPHNIPKWRFDLSDAVTMARKKNCRTSVAHPGQYGFDRADFEYFKELGVDAVEVYHPRNSHDQRRTFLEWAKQLDFMVTGGSDFHDIRGDALAQEPTLGRLGCPWSDAENFLRPWL